MEVPIEKFQTLKSLASMSAWMRHLQANEEATLFDVMQNNDAPDTDYGPS